VTMSCPAGKAPAAPFAPYYPTPVPDAPVAALPSRSAGKQKRSGKPAGLATMEEMVFEALKGGAWMRPTQVTQAIRDRYWPSAPRNSAPPVMWRMWQAHRLEKSENGYRLPVAHPMGSAAGNGVAVA
jgi:hypothetical protein